MGYSFFNIAPNDLSTTNTNTNHFCSNANRVKQKRTSGWMSFKFLDDYKMCCFSRIYKRT
jgi:hypothetical protein